MHTNKKLTAQLSLRAPHPCFRKKEGGTPRNDFVGLLRLRLAMTIRRDLVRND